VQELQHRALQRWPLRERCQAVIASLRLERRRQRTRGAAAFLDVAACAINSQRWCATGAEVTGNVPRPTFPCLQRRNLAAPPGIGSPSEALRLRTSFLAPVSRSRAQGFVGW
jgi:hypothetical protein